MYVVQEHAADPLSLVIAAAGHLVLHAPLNRGPHTLRPTLMEQLSLTKLRLFLLAQKTLQVLDKAILCVQQGLGDGSSFLVLRF